MDGLIRRSVDVLVSLVALVLLGPVFLLISLLIKRDTEGPVIFRQQRVGRCAKTFDLLKFRTMTVQGASQLPQVTASGDSRITPIGRRLRSTKLDELPQLVNVLKADMSLVGPRPEVPRYASLWTPEQRTAILSVRPGITDPVTVDLRREEEILGAVSDPERYYMEVLLPEKARRYVDYVNHRGLLSDAALLVRSAWVIAWR